MNHPINFRVWSNLESKWMDNIVLSAQGTPILLYSEKVDKRVFHRVYLIDNYQPVVQWSTGLKDKIGVMIYEGDILKLAGVEYLIRWFDGSWQLGSIDNDEFIALLNKPHADESEVIDNILEREARAKVSVVSTEAETEPKIIT
jgi:hypothetical protein